jgi:hypothetical protein
VALILRPIFLEARVPQSYNVANLPLVGRSMPFCGEAQYSANSKNLRSSAYCSKAPQFEKDLNKFRI